MHSHNSESEAFMAQKQQAQGRRTVMEVRSHQYHERRGGDWDHSLCDCSPCGSCMLATFCPCFLVGRTNRRLEDPSMSTGSSCNGACCLHCGLSLFALGWIQTMIERGNIRQRFAIQGSCCGDYCTSFWCHCCAVIQADEEVKVRTTGVNSTGYQGQQGMRMEVPQGVHAQTGYNYSRQGFH